MEFILTFESHRYFMIPHLRVSEYVDIVHQLLALAPDDGPIELDQAVEELRFRAKRAEIRMAALADEYDPEAEQREVEFERWTDNLANAVYTGFEQWSLFVSPVSSDPDEDPATRLEKHERAARGRVIHESWFGEDGLDFFRLSYRQRFATLSAMLRTLAEDDLDLNFAELLTPALAEGRVVGVSEMYEQRLAAHLRERDESVSLANHRVALRWAIAAYDHPLGLMADRWSKESCDRINAMIEPLADAYLADIARERAKWREAATRLDREAKDEGGGDEQA